MEKSELIGNWNYPTAVRVGAGRISELAECCRLVGISSPLVITDPLLAEMPMLVNVLEDLKSQRLDVGLFGEVKGNPVGQNVSGGVAAYREGHHDGVIAFGGGSAIDAGKAVALMVGQEGTLWDYEDAGDNWLKADASAIAPIIAVPTTAGTGSEVGRAALITDETRSVKKIIFHPRLLPVQVVLDPELTLGLPPSLTAATGMDALSHNLEALCASSYHPMAAGIAVEGIRLIREYLPRAVKDGGDLEARTQMIVASSMGATAFQKGLGAMHALAHPLGALYDAHHGMLNAILMPYVLQANRVEITEPIARAAAYIGLSDPGFEGFLQWVLDLREGIAIPHDLAGIGIDEHDVQRVGEMAAQDPTAATNPIAFTAVEYSAIFRRAVRGEL